MIISTRGYTTRKDGNSNVESGTNNRGRSSDDRRIVLLGEGVGKIFQVGKQKMNAFAQVFYNVEKPDAVADWSLRLQLQFLFPK